MTIIKGYKSEIVDVIIMTLEQKLKETGRHLIKTDTIFMMCKGHIDLSDDVQERTELLEIGMRQVIQSRLYAHGYFSVVTGYFVNVVECENLWYLNMIIDGKDTVIKGKIAARNRIKELKKLAGSIVMIPDENNSMVIREFKTEEEMAADLEADAI